MKARMICDFNNELSMKYADYSIKSFEGSGIEIEKVQCVTPDTIKDQSFVIEWEDYLRTNKYKDQKRVKTITEQACFMSHFREWLLIAETGKRHIILEHDACLDRPDKWGHHLPKADIYELWNPGIAMECYTMSPRLARFIELSYIQGKVRACAGPMAELFTSCERWCTIAPYRDHSDTSVLWPDHTNLNMVATGNDMKHLQHIIQKNVNLQFVNRERAAVTQVYCPNRGRTLDHGADASMVYGGTTIRQMRVVDAL
jgi:hypothetical protein